VAEDKLTWTFNLRRGVKFHDGTDFNAEAVVFNLDRVSKRDTPFFDQALYAASAARVGTLDSYRAVDSHVVEIKTRFPFSFLPWDMGSTLIASPTAVRRLGNKEFQNTPSGTGPFRVDKYVDGQVLEMVPNKESWGRTAKLDRLIVRPMPEPATRLAALQAGQVLWAEVPPPDAKKQLEAEGFNVILKQYPHAIRIDLNVNERPFDDPRVREALNHAVDRSALCTSLLGGLCAPSTQLMYKGHPWYDETVGDTYGYDPKKAKDLLAAAGHANGFRMTVAYPTGGSGNMWPGPMMELVQRNLKDIGVDVDLAPLEWNSILTIYRAGLHAPENKKYQALYFSPNTHPPTALLNYLSSRIQPQGCCNDWGYRSADVDRLLTAAQSEFDPAKQDQLIKQAMGAMAKDAPSIFLVHDLNFRVLSPRVRGFVQSQSWWADLTTVWVKP
jgi:peptide/nickel transport system substrate-binding protein